MFQNELAWLRRQSVRGLLAQFLTVLTVLSTSLALYKGLSCVVDSESPVVVVLSGSMEPAFYRGDLLLLSMPSEKLKVGDIVVYNTVYGGTPIVHRILETHDDYEGNDQLILTKGDNNDSDDVVLYGGPSWLRRSQIVGKVQGYVPYVGYMTIVLNDYPKLKYALLGLIGVSVLFSGEDS
ncbi:signal peptidase I [Jaminaea rosea]|uniref:Signal peptidase complex catalytic subunit SEC11 n=1 Tax=Jaminaea rosea TaxID=1569628 RepID=A0A316UYD6_9BASI|nr:signal peptidase I [Jaminaea rosea]PWN29798.1 signal peptidase I [Jaminaea rosea]